MFFGAGVAEPVDADTAPPYLIELSHKFYLRLDGLTALGPKSESTSNDKRWGSRDMIRIDT